MSRLRDIAKDVAKINPSKSIHITGADVKADAKYSKLTPEERLKVENMRKIRGNMIFLKLPKKQDKDKTTKK
jgi:hypothetical protein